MSETIDVKLSNQEYNVIFGIASSLTGDKSKFAATKVMDLIRDEVQKGSEGDKLPDEISVKFPKKILDGFYIGMTEKTKEEKVTTQDILQIKGVCQVLKMKNRFEKFVDEELKSIPENTESFDDEVVEEPFDGE